MLKQELQNLKDRFPEQIDNFYGEGLIASLIFKDSGKFGKSEIASKVSEKCMQKGLLVVHTGRESIKLGPPLVIDDEAILEAMQVIDESLTEILANG
jgi:4-aminobutyrate aminotransferase / (S)-3-amino-2-methylpropionate transaminase / 5-aminovalerate transaminase